MFIILFFCVKDFLFYILSQFIRKSLAASYHLCVRITFLGIIIAKDFKKVFTKAGSKLGVNYLEKGLPEIETHESLQN